MKPNVSLRAWLCLVVSAALATAALGVRTWHPITRAIGEENIAALVAERAKLQGNDDSIRDDLRRQAQALDHETWSQARLAALQQQLGPVWQWSEMPSARGSRGYRVLGTSLALHDWPALMAAVRLLESQRAIAITHLEITAAGEAAHRRFARVEVHLRWTEGNADRAETSRAFPVSPPVLPGTEAGRRAVPRAPGRSPAPAAARVASALAPALGSGCRPGGARSVPTTRQSPPGVFFILNGIQTY